jgi:sulfite exporter TauE/SafE
MPLLLSLFPLYIFGNLHCLGMCGPLVLMIGHHRYRALYFLGRTVSFSLAGWVAGGAGAVLSLMLKSYHISALASFLCAFIILGIAVSNLLGRNYPGYAWITSKLSKTQKNLSLLILRDKPWPAFLFGFFTLALPCGQTILVFSTCALYGEPTAGLLNGFAFAVLTSPSLFAAMHARRFFQKAARHYHILVGISALIIGILALCRGLAEIEIIPHLSLHSNFFSSFHLVIF